MKDLETYQDLLDYLKTLTKEQLQQKPQCGNSTPIDTSIITMNPCIAIGTMDEFEFYGARSATNNKFNPNEIVLFTDHNPFGIDGATSYLLEAIDNKKLEKMKKCKSSKNKLKMIKEWLDGKPCYGPEGPTNPKDQLNPKIVKGFNEAEKRLLKHRCKD